MKKSPTPAVTQPDGEKIVADCLGDTPLNSNPREEKCILKPISSETMSVAAAGPEHPSSINSTILQNGHALPGGSELVGTVQKLHLDQKAESLEKNGDQVTKTLSQNGDAKDVQLIDGVKDSSASAKCSDGTSSVAKTSESAKVSGQVEYVESGKSSVCRGSTSTDVSDESTCSSFSSSMSKPHKANDSRWEAIQYVRLKDGLLGLNHFRLLKRLGCGDIGSVYLSELSGTKSYFAMKVMDKCSLASRKKLLRAQTEREILQLLDHPFLPTLYTHFETEKFSCLVMEFCPGGDLHTLRQRQPGKHFSEQAAKYDSCPLCFSCRSELSFMMCCCSTLSINLVLIYQQFVTHTSCVGKKILLFPFRSRQARTLKGIVTSGMEK